MTSWNIQFDTVKARRKYTYKCVRCEKRVRRAFTVEHSINPYNTNKDGRIKGRAEVSRDAEDEASERLEVEMKSAIYCSACAGAATGDANEQA